MPDKYDVAINFIVSRRGEGINKVQNDLKKVSQATKEVERSGNSAFDSLLTGWNKIGLAIGAGVAAIYTAKKAFDFAQEGAELNQLGESFDRLNASVFHTPDLLNRMREASRGTIDDATLMQGVLTLSAGATDEVARAMAEAAPRLLEIAKASNKLNPALGDTSFLFESISKGVKRQSPLILDNLGLNIKLGKAYSDFAKSAGKSVDALDANERVMATLNATLLAGDQLIKQVGGSIDSQADSYERATTALKNYTNQAKQSLAITVANNLGVIESTDQWNELRRTLLDAGASWGDINDIVEDGRAQLDLWRTEADFKRDVDANTRGIERMAFAIEALNKGLEVGTDEFNDYVKAQEESGRATDTAVSSAFNYARSTQTTEERLKALRAALDKGIISQNQYNKVVGIGYDAGRLNQDALEDLEKEVKRNAAAQDQLNEQMERHTVAVQRAAAVDEDWTDVLGRMADNADEFADKLAQQNAHLSDTEAFVRAANVANQEYFDGLERGTDSLDMGEEFRAGRNNIDLLNQSLDELGSFMVMVGGRTADQNAILSDAQDEYNRLGAEIARMTAAPELYGLTVEEAAEKTAKLAEEQANLVPLMDRMGSITGTAALATREATSNFDAMSQALFDMVASGGASSEQIADMGLALGTLNPQQADGIVLAFELNKGIEAIDTAFKSGALSADQAKAALETLANDGLAAAQDQIDETEGKLNPLNTALQALGMDIPTITVQADVQPALTELNTLKGDLESFLAGDKEIGGFRVQNLPPEDKAAIEGDIAELNNAAALALGLDVTDAETALTNFDTSVQTFIDAEHEATIGADVEPGLTSLNELDTAAQEIADKQYQLEMQADTIAALNDVSALKTLAQETAGTYDIIFRYQTEGTPPTTPPGRAFGGPIEPDKLYRVGERGPEYFMSNVAGYISPNAPPTNTAAPVDSKEGGQQINIERLEISFPGVRTNNPRQLAGMVASELGNKVRG